MCVSLPYVRHAIRKEKDMQFHGTHIDVRSRPMSDYIVEFAFILDADADNADMNHVYRIEVKAVSMIDAINVAQDILVVEKANTFQGFLDSGQASDNMSADDIKDEKQDIMRAWILDDPSAIQVFTKDSIDMLRNVTEQSVMENMENISDEVEEFLKEQ